MSDKPESSVTAEQAWATYKNNNPMLERLRELYLDSTEVMQSVELESPQTLLVTQVEPYHPPSAADLASAAECAAAGQHQTATDVTGRAWCVVCGSDGNASSAPQST